jgi:hypothetical protein
MFGVVKKFYTTRLSLAAKRVTKREYDLSLFVMQTAQKAIFRSCRHSNAEIFR